MDSSVNSSNTSIVPLILDCPDFRTSSFIFTCYIIVYFLFLPIFISVLYISYWRWRKQRSASVSMATTHSDVFTFHMVAMEMVNVVGSCLYCWYLFTGTKGLVLVEGVFTILSSYGQMFFHVLTCLERYLAVIHPITYQGLKQVGGVRIRNLSIGCVWLLSFGFTIHASVVGFYEQSTMIISLFVVDLSAAFIAFWSFSVLCVLIHPGPGEVGGDRKLTDKSKRRALNTMMIILGALLLKLICYLMVCMSDLLHKWNVDQSCVMLASSSWFNLPSSLVLPLLFLYRAGKLPRCQQKQ